jgi:hypothetical protein
MAVISPNSFDPLRRYVSVRLAQGVPLVDADWNESEDIRRFELRAFVRWFVGDGIPLGNDGFRIGGIGGAGSRVDFRIMAGGGAAPMAAGRMFVDGLEAFIVADTLFTAQPLHASQPGAAALAARWGVPAIVAIVPGTTPLSIYLDVWERLVTAAEDATLILAGLGTESCSRLRREWVVRVRTPAGGSGVPQSGDPDFRPGHSYAMLAQVTRTALQELTDQTLGEARRTGLQVSSRRDLEQLTGDVFGPGYAVDGTGTPKLAFSLRDVLNGVLRDRPSITVPVTRLTGGAFNLPTTAPAPDGTFLYWVRVAGVDRFLSRAKVLANGTVTPAEDEFQFTGVLNVTSMAIVHEDAGFRRIFYTGQAGTAKLFSRRFDPGAPPATRWGAPLEVGSPDLNIGVVAMRLSDNSTQIAWVGQNPAAPATPTVFTQNFLPGAGANSLTVVGTSTDAQARVAIVPGPQILLFEQAGGTLSILSKTSAGGAWPATWTSLATMPASAVRDFAAGFIAPGRLWLAYALTAPGGGTQLIGRTSEAGLLGEARPMVSETGSPRYPNLAVDSGNASVFYQDGNAVRQVSFVTKI